MRQIIRRFQTRQTKRAPKKDAVELGSKLPDLNFREYGEFSLGRLPTEILLDIMEIILSEDSRPVTRTTLRLVSRSWCSLFGPDGYPTLWTSASIPIPGQIEKMDGCIEYCHNFTLYSGTNQLDIVLDYRRISTETRRLFFLAFDDRTHLTSRVEQLEPTLQVPLYTNPIIFPLLLLTGPAGKFMQRWRSLTIHSVKADELYEDLIFPYISSPAPNLTSMSFQRSGSLPRPYMGGLEMALTLKCPNLHRLRLRNIAWNLSAEGYEGSIFSNLRHLELFHCSEHPFALALLCPNLETLSVECAPSTTLMRYPNFNLPRLRKLSVLGRLVSYHPIWRKVSFPALEHVRLWCPNILNDIDDVSYNLNQLSDTVFQEGALSPRFPKLRDVFLDLPKPHESRLFEVGVDRIHFTRETLIYLTRIKALATAAEVEYRAYEWESRLNT